MICSHNYFSFYYFNLESINKIKAEIFLNLGILKFPCCLETFPLIIIRE